MTEARGRVYLAGPPYAEEYRRRAEALVRELGWEPVDPMRRDFRGQTQGHEAEIVDGDLREIASCDAVLAAFTAPDEGTAMEAWYAHSLGKRVIAYTGNSTIDDGVLRRLFAAIVHKPASPTLILSAVQELARG